MTRWLKVALVLGSSLVAGCYATYGLSTASDDAGVEDASFVDVIYIPDLGMCSALPSTVGGLTCPSLVAPGDPVLVTVQHAPTICCSGDAARLVAQPSGPRSIALLPSWDSCGCCAECDCVGPTVRQALDLGPLTEGVWTVTADAARGFTCTIEVRATTCVQQDVRDALAPTAVRADEQVPVLLHAPGASCGCTPRGFSRVGREGGYYVGLETCGCSPSDPCVDPPYEATAFVDGSSLVGPWSATTTMGTVTTQIVRPTACTSGPFVRSVELLGVDPAARHDAPIGVFARVGYEAAFCCIEPKPIATELFSPDPSGRHYELLNCADGDCSCIPGPAVSLSAVVYLGQFGPGAQRVTVGGVETSFVVPSR